MDIKNCQVKYRCPKTWGSLIKTEDARIRYCNECDRGVHSCSNEDDLLDAMKNDWCVAIQIDSSDRNERIELIGDVEFVGEL